VTLKCQIHKLITMYMTTYMYSIAAVNPTWTVIQYTFSKYACLTKLLLHLGYFTQAYRASNRKRETSTLLNSMEAARLTVRLSNIEVIKADFQSILHTLESLFMFFALHHERHHKM